MRDIIQDSSFLNSNFRNSGKYKFVSKRESNVASLNNIYYMKEASINDNNDFNSRRSGGLRDSKSLRNLSSLKTLNNAPFSLLDYNI